MKIIYQRWFIEFEFPNDKGEPYRTNGGEFKYNDLLKNDIPRDWKSINITEIADITWGQCPEGKNILSIDTKIPNVMDYCSGAGDMKGGFLVDCQAKTDNAKRLAKDNDILVSIAGKIGDMCVVDHIISLGRAAMAYSVKNFEDLTYLYNSLKTLNKKFKIMSTGSIQKVINTAHIADLNIPYNSSVVSEFSKITQPLFQAIKINSIENRKLTNLRDFLLPMLMNGQINVDDIDI